MVQFMHKLIESATGELMLQAIRALLEERKIGKAGPEFELFNDDLSYYLKIDKKNRLEMLLAGKIVFLLATAYASLDQAKIDPRTQEFEDPGPMAGTKDDPRNMR